MNTTDSRVEVAFDLTTSSALNDDERERAIDRLGTDRITITASEHRSQHRNRVAARQRLADRLREALAPAATPPGADQADPRIPASAAGRQEAAVSHQGHARPRARETERVGPVAISP